MIHFKHCKKIIKSHKEASQSFGLLLISIHLSML